MWVFEGHDESNNLNINITIHIYGIFCFTAMLNMHKEMGTELPFTHLFLG